MSRISDMPGVGVDEGEGEGEGEERPEDAVFALAM